MHSLGRANSRQAQLYVDGSRFMADLWFFDDGHVEVREITLESGELVTSQPFDCKNETDAITAAEGRVAEWLRSQR